VVPDTEETLMLTEESHSKMIEKQNDPQMIENKTELSAEQAFWSQYSVQTDEPNLSGNTIVEVPKELPKVSMVNSCLKKLKFHLASFDMVVKERTTATAITEGTWGFEPTKACFRDDIIPIMKILKELFTSFDQCLIDEVTEVQNVFTQMEMAVEQHCEEKAKTACARCVTTESELKIDFIKNECYDTLLQKYHTLKKHCITLEVNNQLNTEIFHRDTLSSQESAPTFAKLFEINDLKAQAQAKDSMILKLKEKLNSLNGDVKERKVKREVEKIETLNIELDHKITKLAAENEHLKQTYKQLYDSIKSLRVRSKEQCDDLIHKVNLKSAEVSDLNASLQEKVLVDVAPLVTKLRKNRTARTNYIRHTQEEAATLREIVERNVCPLTRIPTPSIVPPREPIPIVNSTDKPVVTLVYSRKPKTKKVSNKMEPNNSWGSLSSNVPSLLFACRKGLVRGLPKLKFEKDHLCSACAMGKSTRKTHKPKSEDTNQEKLYLLHMDLCGPMRGKSVNGKKYILVIVDDYSRFTWVKYLRSKDETPDFIIKFLKMIQVRLKVPVRQAVATACFTQNHSIIRLRHGKTPYELLHSKLPDLSFLHVFGALCYPTNDSENLGKLQPKADIEIFIGYAPTKKAF
nr:hypothetical protein [Tanacetum cinerariifolium]